MFVLFVGYDFNLLIEFEMLGFEDDLEKEIVVLFEKFAVDFIEDLLFVNFCIYVFIYLVLSFEWLI